jgi:uncharacterized protein
MKLNEEALREVCARNDVSTLRLFGSFARDEAKADSDVDLLVEFGSSKSLWDLVRIEREFSERLGRKVDLLTPMSVSPHLRDRILAEAKLLYRRHDAA